MGSIRGQLCPVMDVVLQAVEPGIARDYVFIVRYVGTWEY